MSRFECWNLSNVSAKIAVAIFGVNMLIGPNQLSTFDTAHPRKPRFCIELQPRIPKDKNVRFYCGRSNSGFINIEFRDVSHAPTTYRVCNRL
jgi:hypothetical protein